MSTATITINCNDDSPEVEIVVAGGDGTRAREVAEYIMDVVHELQGGNAAGDPYEVEVH